MQNRPFLVNNLGNLVIAFLAILQPAIGYAGCTPSVITPSTINVCTGGNQVALTVSNPGGGSFGSLNGSATGTTVNYSGSLGNYYIESGNVAASEIGRASCRERV